MTSFVFSSLKGKTTAFNANTDSIIFSFSDGEASAFTFLQSGSTVQIFKTSEQGLGASAIATLSGVTLNALAGSNFLFPGQSQVFIGDNTNAEPPAGSTALDEGANNLSGTLGGDAMFGRGGNDTLTGSTGQDFLQGNAGQDSLDGGEGSDTLLGGQDADILNGGDERDLLSGNAGNDTILAGGGSNTVQGNEGDDSITGGTGYETIHGGQGNDTISSGSGFDTIDGGAGNDVILVAPISGETTSVIGGLGNDSISAAAAASGSAVVLLGNQGNDTILGSINAEVIQGGQDNDSLEGDLGNDTLFGNLGTDTLQGEEGNDSLLGGDGNDSIVGGTGNDTMIGGLGNDTIQVDNVTLLTENDLIQGNAGTDILRITPLSISLSAGFFNNVSGIEVIQMQSGLIEIDDALLSRTDAGALTILASSAQSTPTITVNIGAVAANRTVTLQAADDERFQLSGLASKVTLSENAERVIGTGNSDTILGGAGNDTITGAVGTDILTGSTGSDFFRYPDTTHSNAIDGVDRLTDFRTGTDQIQIAAVEASRTTYTPRAGSANTLADVAALVNGAFNTNATGNGDSQIINITGGSLSGRKYIAIGNDGAAGFQSTDLLIELAGTSDVASSTDITAIT